MKLFWKIFFTTMFVSVTSLALGGYLLIHSNLQTLLEKEGQTAYDYGDIVYYSLANELKTARVDPFYFSTLVETETISESVNRVASSISINGMNQKISFGILRDDGTTVYSSLPQTLDKDIIGNLGENQKAWIIKETDSGIYMQAVRPALLEDTLFYIETVRDVTPIFQNQRAQYHTLLKIMFGMIFLAGLFTLAISKLLLRQVESLSRVTKEISAGNLSKRASVQGNDEIAELSKNFNWMANELEEKMNHLQEEADKKELFVGAFSHELKTPLTSIIGYSDMLRRKKMDPEQLHTCAEYIYSQGKRLEALSLRLMELIILKNQELQRVPVDMEEFLDEVYSILSPQLEQKNIALLCEIEPAIISMEPDFMKTVFLNLIDNGKKAMDSGGKISVKGRWMDGIYTVTIQDTGKGMKRQELSKIREAFYMVDKSRSRKQGGAGLGLAICDEIVKPHGFSIHFQSEIHVGTTVTVIMGREKQDE